MKEMEEGTLNFWFESCQIPRAERAADKEHKSPPAFLPSLPSCRLRSLFLLLLLSERLLRRVQMERAWFQGGTQKRV